MFIESPGAKLHYEFDDAKDRPVVVFSSSLGADLSMWNAQMAAVRDAFSVLRYDNRGHGSSSVTDGPYTIEELGQDVLALLNGLNLARVHFCGLSMGGLIGQWMAIHASERIDRLVLSNTAAKIGTVEAWNQRIATIKANGMSPILPGILERWFRPGFEREHPEAVEAVANTFLATNPEGYAASCAAVRDADFRQNLRTITSPTLVIFGREDPVTTEADAAFLAEQISDVRTLGVDGAHLSNVDSSEAWTTATLAFLLEGEPHG